MKSISTFEKARPFTDKNIAAIFQCLTGFFLKMLKQTEISFA